MGSSSDITSVKLLKKLLLEIRVLSIAHARLSDRNQSLARWMEYPVVLCSTVATGTAAFGLEECSQPARIVIAVSAFLTTVFAGFQRVLGFREAADGHGKLQNEYVNLLREVEGFLAIHAPSQAESYTTFTHAVISRMREFESRDQGTIDDITKKEIEHSITNGDKAKLRMYLLDKVASTQGQKYDTELMHRLDDMKVESVRDIMIALSNHDPIQYPLPSNVFIMDKDQLITYVCLQWRVNRYDLNRVLYNQGTRSVFPKPPAGHRGDRTQAHAATLQSEPRFLDTPPVAIRHIRSPVAMERSPWHVDIKADASSTPKQPFETSVSVEAVSINIPSSPDMRQMSLAERHQDTGTYPKLSYDTDTMQRPKTG